MDTLTPLPLPPSLLGESPFWHPTEQQLYWCDIPGRRLNRHDPVSGASTHWDFDCDLGSCAPRADGSLVLARRDGLWRFNPARGDAAPAEAALLAAPPYDPAHERFNDGKAGPDGAFWVGTIYEPRDKPAAALYRWAGGTLQRVAGEVTVSNGLAWSPDGATLYWSDTKAHTIYAMAINRSTGLPGPRRVFAQFAPRDLDAPMARYAGRPDGATVDAEGCLWVAMFEGARLLRLSPSGELLRTVHLPVRCPTMPCLGGPDLRTLYLTSGREKRPAEELAAMPLSGCVLQLRVDVPGLAAHLVN